MEVFHSVPNWITAVPAARECKEALIAIASVAAVVWTGGVIAATIKRLSPALIGANNLLQFSFIVPLIALFLDPLTLRFTAALLLILHIVFGLVDPLKLYSAEFFENVALKDKSLASEFVKSHKIVSGFAMSFYLPVMIFPTQYVVAWCSVILLFAGLQLLLLVLYLAPMQKRAQ